MDRADWAPSAADVGSVIYLRTFDNNGRYLGTFNSHTRPQDYQLDDLIDTAVSDIYAEIGKIPDEIQDSARRLAAIGAAIYVETSFYADERDSVYSRLVERYDKWFDRLKAQVDAIENGGETGDDSGPLPVACFPEPEDDNALVGWNTRF